MRNATLQLLANAPGISRADVAADTPGVRITGIARPGSPNYLIAYLDISAATPGRIGLRITLDGTERTVEYELRPRRTDLGCLGRLSCADVVYLLLPDRFAQGRTGNSSVGGMMPYRTDRSEPSLRHGGDLEGIRCHLDYFAELGVTALWLTPVLENNSPDSGRASSYHGYAITDFYRTDPRLGTNDDYCRLVAEAHQRGLKVVMDMVFNHCGIWHPWLRDLPSADWINRPERPAAANDVRQGAKYLQTNYRLTPTVDHYAADADLRETTEGWFVPSMPDLNQHNPHLMTYLSQCSKWWIETSGADAIRMDTYPYAFADAMAGWAKEMSEEYPWLNIIGETWVTEPAFTASWQRGSAISRLDTGLQTVMDFALFDRLNAAKDEETDDFQSGLNRVYNTFAYDFLYPSPENVLAFIDIHRQPRHRTLPRQRLRHIRAAPGAGSDTRGKAHTADLLRHGNTHERHKRAVRRQREARLSGRIPRRRAGRVHPGGPHPRPAGNVRLAQPPAQMAPGLRGCDARQHEALHPPRRCVRHPPPLWRQQRPARAQRNKPPRHFPRPPLRRMRAARHSGPRGYVGPPLLHQPRPPPAPSPDSGAGVLRDAPAHHQMMTAKQNL